jgi:hypothetical protein
MKNLFSKYRGSDPDSGPINPTDPIFISILEKIKKKLINNKTFKYDTVPGMLTLQADTEFKKNDIYRGVGYHLASAAITGYTNDSLMAYGQYIQNYGINGLTGENPSSVLTTADAGGKRFLTAGTVVSGRLSEPVSSTSVPATTFCSNYPSVYNNGNMWLHWLTGGIEYDLITASKEEIAQMGVQEKLSLFFKNLRSKNAENLYLTNLVKFYFSNPSSVVSEASSYCPHIGLWSRPPVYAEDEFGNEFLEGYESGNFVEQKNHHTFCISDRYNWFIRTNFHIDGKLLDKLKRKSRTCW